MRTCLTLLLFTLLCTCARAQDFSGGFRAGLNFVALSGPLEMTDEGLETQTRRRATGFHVGATFALAFTDLVGVKADVMYSQKGGQILFDGPSTLYLYQDAGDTGLPFSSTRTSDIDIVNSYIDVPLTVYYRLGNLEIEGGVSAGFLVNSRVTGGVMHTDIDRLGSAEVVYSIDGRYFSDDAGFEGITSSVEGSVGPNGEPIPQTVSAYYDNLDDEKLYRRLDFGLVGGLAYYLNNGLYIGARYQLGLTDVSKGENDLRITRNEENLGTREFNTEDKDYTRSIQASVGFRF